MNIYIYQAGNGVFVTESDPVVTEDLVRRGAAFTLIIDTEDLRVYLSERPGRGTILMWLFGGPRP